MTDQPHGLARGLTNYGDADFSRAVVGIAQSRTNRCLGEAWVNERG